MASTQCSTQTRLQRTGLPAGDKLGLAGVSILTLALLPSRNLTPEQQVGIWSVCEQVCL